MADGFVAFHLLWLPDSLPKAGGFRSFQSMMWLPDGLLATEVPSQGIIGGGLVTGSGTRI